MNDGEALLQKRFQELAHRAFARCGYTYSEFLTPAEQELLHRTPFDGRSAPFGLFGGHEEAERRLAQFGSADMCGYEEAAPIACVAIAPAAQKFADALTHRDFLGALMGLGVRRSVLGDIVLHDNRGYLFCHTTISGFIGESLTQVGRTPVRCEAVSGLPDIAVQKPDIQHVNVASERLDAVIAAVYRLPRTGSAELFRQGRVFVDSRIVGDGGRALKAGSTVSVRGLGRFAYEGVARETRKGRGYVQVRVY